MHVTSCFYDFLEQRERFLFLSFTLSLVTWACSQGVQGSRERGTEEKECGKRGKKSGSELVRGDGRGGGEEGSNGM